MKSKDNHVIIIDPEILGGTPVFSGTRVPVKFFFEYILTFPTVNKDQALQLLEIEKKLIIQK